MRPTILACVLLATACSSDEPPPWADPDPEGSDRLLGYDQTPELELLISADGMASLEAEPRTYVSADLVFEGVTYGPVGVRLKGQNSFQPITGKPSLRININAFHDDASLYGLKDMTLNNMAGDPSMMHERLAYKVARDSGVPASRCNHAMVTINGELYGLYANVETVKKRMLGQWFEDNDGSLFTAQDVDFVPSYVEAFELESGEDDRHHILLASEALQNPDAEAALNAAGGYIDMEAFRRFWAMTALIAQFDSFPYSMPGDDYFLYADPTSDKLHFIPWGMDETFLSAQLDPRTLTTSVLAETCKRSPSCLQGFVDQTWALLALTEDGGLDGERERVVSQIAPLIAQDTRRPYDDAMVAEMQTQLRYFIQGRRQTLTEILGPPPGN